MADVIESVPNPEKVTPEFMAGISSGLCNSVTFVTDMLQKEGAVASWVHAVDNNCINRLVTESQATHVIIEALWVVPEKFSVLQHLHPNVKWIIRLHSEVPFLANEFISIDWIKRYVLHTNVYVSCNSLRATEDIASMLDSLGTHDNLRSKVIYLPNYYPIEGYIEDRVFKPHEKGILNVGCFGAIRPLKNNLLQAIAAMNFAVSYEMQLRFHINSDRTEQGGGSALNNIKALFNGSQHELVLHPWLPHGDFKRLMETMDINMSISLTETFSIVSADGVERGVPTVVSPEISWAHYSSHAQPTDMISIFDALKGAWFYPDKIRLNNFIGLKRFSNSSRNVWLSYLNQG